MEKKKTHERNERLLRKAGEKTMRSRQALSTESRHARQLQEQPRTDTEKANKPVKTKLLKLWLDGRSREGLVLG